MLLKAGIKVESFIWK